ncbi:hypothetical protein BCR34DRAFT_574303 [Clohesyomyces aquaticus]|uniref:Ankyrin repeat-containing domain protein n=1 Tax=Clohesyomyces aquaticus TaxID=1231657 RepID=A0A1Y1YW99_9PLEO|nr:hypothetical protein BCR34DRAFT_574303 [Clohesyomyces aquaticus]
MELMDLPHMSTFLKHRVQCLNGPHARLPEYIKALVDDVIHIEGEDSEEKRTICTRALCQQLSDNFDDTYFLVAVSLTARRFPNKHTEIQIEENVSKLSAAAAFGSATAFQKYSKTTDEVWAHSSMLGIPLHAAAKEGQLHIVQIITKSLDRVYEPSKKEKIMYLKADRPFPER